MKSNQIVYVSISLSIIISVFVFSNAIKNRNESSHVIAVTGMAERNFESDLIVWRSQFTVKEMNLTSAYAQLKKNAEITRKFLELKGVQAKEMTFSAIYISKETRNVASGSNPVAVFDGYRLTQEISITSNLSLIHI